MLCEGLWCANQPESSVGTSLRTAPPPQHRDIKPFFPKEEGKSAPSFITVLLSHCQEPFLVELFQESDGIVNLGRELKTLHPLIWIMASLSELRGRCRLSSAVAITYNYLDPFSISMTLLRIQESLHLCQSTLGKPFTAPNFLMHCVPCWLFLAVSIRCKRNSCDFVKIWKAETPLWVFLNFSTLFFCQHVDVWCNMKNCF